MNRGFTFIEIMIVVFLISLITGITTIFFANTLPSAKHRAAARELASTLKYARHLAFAKNEKQVIDIDLDAKKYSLKAHGIKSIAPDIAVTIYGEDGSQNPVREGKYVISYDTACGNGWNRIELARKDKTITIESDPIMIAKIIDGKSNENDGR